MIENNQVIKEVLNTIINISGRKTTQSHAIYMLESTLKNLKEKYSFLNNITVQDTTYLEEGDPISIMGEVNKITSKEIGPAVKEIITTLNTSLADDAGHFFLKELSHKLNGESLDALKSMDVDLDLMHLEQQISKMEKNIFK
ncbi:MAG: hypothetical protein KGY65_01375 [Candidatus Thermoplasmatota archaeon]|nr:hypothetical protein [Candidatus Thermoplasmatota archaeon]MBS3801381.1 hypothetical protein [Candidatus Thermoplasmatota archaeon]